MSVRRLIVEVGTDELNVTRFCREHGISTWFFYELRRRYAAGGLDAIEPRSRAAHRVANRTSSVVEDAIIELRKELDAAGLDAGAATIAYHLRARAQPVPSESTIWRVLRRRGFITPEPSKAPKRTQRRFAAERANECWQNDDTHWQLADSSPVKIINVLDDCTRVLTASRAVRNCTAGAVFETFASAAREWGWPERVLSDNAKAHHSLHDAFAALGIRTGHPRPYHPQTCGKVERLHSTLKRYLAAQDPAETIEAVQAQLDTFRQLYNHQRPHRALERRIPAQVWQDTPRSGPANRPISAPTEIHHVVVHATGKIRIGNRYYIIVGRAHAARPSITVITGLACHVFIDGQLIRSLTLDPSRNVQPLYKRTRPNTVSDAPRHP